MSLRNWAQGLHLPLCDPTGAGWMPPDGVVSALGPALLRTLLENTV